MTDSTTTITPDTTTVPGAVAAAENTADNRGMPRLADYDEWLAGRAELVDDQDRFAKHSAMRRATREDYGRWLSHVHSAAGCTNPVRLAGKFRTATVNTTTGEVTGQGRNGRRRTCRTG